MQCLQKYKEAILKVKAFVLQLNTVSQVMHSCGEM